ncbi:histidine phosphatase family protein [Actinobacteria bacterium YIM 96077]|uniref:Histidine phosphatase family protein n=1 Tax=Phytoactinopolyspora halophila TaxID=1981511 RepID=A0A329QC79_9ACTN|nr:histidine phosphatase family protein [Phytoactinopolyspora halophila]AYY14108.1 histidine phosphatase family protein [Actinobacteria bacterium YIM 96077]RAW09956.1 histidine phosphatase family protein [Phytoactinopolyspora halophila]
MSLRWAEKPAHSVHREARLVLIRHGESEWNAEGRIQGQHGTGLSARGRAQAEDVATYLTAAFPDPVLVVASDLERVTQTAAPYVSSTGATVEVDKRLREIDTGAWSGLIGAEVAERFPDEIAAVRRGEDIPRGGGERFADLRVRVAEALHDLARQASADANAGATPTALIFTHGGPIRVSVAAALDLPEGGHQLLDPPENCSVTVLTFVLDESGDVAAIRLGNYNGHVSARIHSLTS